MLGKTGLLMGGFEQKLVPTSDIMVLPRLAGSKDVVVLREVRRSSRRKRQDADMYLRYKIVMIVPQPSLPLPLSTTKNLSTEL